MRPIGIILFFCGAIHITHAQTFNTRNDYKGNGSAEFGFGIEKQDSNYVVVQGCREPWSAGLRIGLTTISLSGVVMDERSFGEDSVNHYVGWANSSDVTWDGGIVNCGTRDTNNYANAFVSRYTDQLDLLWGVRLFTDTLYKSVGQMAKAHLDSTILAVGSVWSPGESIQIFLAKLDQFGQVLWTQKYGGTERDEPRTIDVSPTGDIYIGCFTESQGGLDTDPYIIKTDPNGNMIWDVVYNGVFDECTAQVAATQDGGVVFAGCSTLYELGPSAHTRLLAVKYDANGTLVWEKMYGEVRHLQKFSSVKALDDGTFIAAGDLMGVNYPHGTLLRFAANGDSIWQRQYVHPSTTDWLDFHELLDVIPEEDGGFVACGVLLDTAGQDMWVFRTDSFGCVVPGCQLLDNIAEQGIALAAKVFPNPTSDVLNVHFTSVAVPQGTFYLHDLHGREVYRFEPRSRNANYTLDLRHLSSGLYLLTYRDKGAVLWKEKIVVER